MKTSDQFAPRVRFGPYEANLATRELRKDGLKVKLAGQPFQVLTRLLERPGEVVTREEIREELWADDTFVDFEHSLNSAIKKLRQALGDSPDHPRYVETLPRLGYRFIAPVDSLPTSASSPETKSETRGSLALLAGLLVVVSASGYLAWRHSHPRVRAHTGKIMLAVLPFQNLTGDPGQEYLSDGVTEEMITQLSRLDSNHFGVIARSSVMGYKYGNKGLEPLGRELGVQYVLEGTVRRASDRIRVTTQLIRLEDQSHVWAQEYDRNLRDVLALESEVAQAVTGEIELKLRPQEQVRLAQFRPVSPEAYEEYLKGRYLLNTRTPEAIERGVENFQRAIEKDPAYGAAYAGLASCYVLLAWEGINAKESASQATIASRKALEVDAGLAEPHAVLALVAQNHDWNWTEAERQYKRAIELEPGYAIARTWYSLNLALRGRFEEAIRQIDQAHALDPLSLLIQTDKGLILYFARRNDEAMEQFRNVSDMNPGFPAYNRALARAQKGLFKEAIADLELERQRYNTPRTLAYLGYVYGSAGKKAEAHTVLMELKRRARHEYVSPWCSALVYAGLGEKDQAFARFEKAYQERTPDLVGLKVIPIYDSLRADPRFQDLLRRVGPP